MTHEEIMDSIGAARIEIEKQIATQSAKKNQTKNIVAFLIALVLFGAVYMLNSRASYLGDAAYFVVVFGVIGVFLAYATHTAISSKPKPRIYNSKEATTAVRRLTLGSESISKLSDDEIEGIISPLADFFAAQGNGKLFYDPERYTEFLNMRGLHVAASTVDLVMTAQEVYSLSLQLPTAQN